jgi:predicted site-specific integrase-resolvase
MAEDKRLIIPLKEAAAMLEMTRQTLMGHVYKGNINCVRFSSKSVHFKPVDIQTFIENHTVSYTPLQISIS